MSSFDLYLVLVCVAIALTKGVSVSALLILFFLFIAFHPSYRLFMVMVIAVYFIKNFFLWLHLTDKISLNGRLSLVNVEED